MYWLIKDGEKVHYVGPFEDWRAACIRAMGNIDESYMVKQVDISGKPNLEKEIEDVRGWFKPMILEDCSFTFDKKKAIGPAEIVVELSRIAAGINKALSLERINALKDEAVKYLRHCPLDICEKFSKLVAACRDRYGDR